MKAFKIIRNADGKMLSLNPALGNLAFNYSVEGWNIPEIPNSYFYCFSTKEIATNFISKYQYEWRLWVSKMELWEVEIKDLIAAPKVIPLSLKEYIYDDWNAQLEDEFEPAPNGSIGCKQLKFITKFDDSWRNQL